MAGDDRRGFLIRLIAIVVGAVLTVFPFAAGLVVFFDPLIRGKRERTFVRVASLEQVPADGRPHAFQVVATQIDKWNRYSERPVAVVFIRRDADTDQIDAFNAECPHLGCLLEFDDAAALFKCPCHKSSFEIDGTRIAPSPSKHDMYVMPIDPTKLAAGEIWVRLTVS